MLFRNRNKPTAWTRLSLTMTVANENGLLIKSMDSKDWDMRGSCDTQLGWIGMYSVVDVSHRGKDIMYSVYTHTVFQSGFLCTIKLLGVTSSD